MRTTPLALALVLVACGSSDRSGTPSAADTPSTSRATSPHGPDQLVLRLPRTGGLVRAYTYPGLDSVVWTSAAAMPALDQVLAFDDGAGSVLALDSKGVPVRLDLRLGGVLREPKPKLTAIASSDGSAVFGLAPDGAITRLTPSGRWSYKPPSPARALLPQPDGALLVVAESGDRTTVWQLRPPETRLYNTATLPRSVRAVRAQAGDRVYFSVDSGLVGIAGRDLAPAPSIRLQHPVRSLATTPSGDRVYVASDSANEVVVVDRYRNAVSARIELPGSAAELRMDPNGRYLLAHPAHGDSAWVLAVGTDRLLGAVRTGWRADLPAVAPDGALALLRAKDVVFADAETLRDGERFAGGGADVWYFITWNGFRPGSLAQDAPAPVSRTLGEADDSAAASAENPFAGQIATADTTPVVVADTARPDPARATRAASAGSGRTPAGLAYSIQFGALRDERSARLLAAGFRESPTPAVAAAQVVRSAEGGATIYRVIAGPFRTREDAERAGRASGKTYWVFQGEPR
ncbi:MAG: SPOR domain-containing protein [Gemmatimonadaceae bacterium]